MSLVYNFLITLLTFSLISTLFHLDCCKAALVVKRSQFHPYATTSMALTFSAEVLNDGKDGAEVSNIPARLEMIVCCQFLKITKLDADVFQTPERDCYSMRVYSGLAYHIQGGQSRNIQAFFMTQYIFNRQGACVFRVHGSTPNKAENEIRIDFDTVIRGGNNATEENGMQACNSLDQDPKKSCENVDCVQKYSGFRSFFNKTTSTCEPTPACMENSRGGSYDIQELERLDHHPSVILDFENNRCVKVEKERSLVLRDVHGENESSTTESIGEFAKTYGASVSKLAAGIFISVVGILVICVLLNLLCGCFCSCNSWFVDLIPYRRPPPNDILKAKYTRIRNEDEGRAADRVIEEVKDRREMRRQSPHRDPKPPPRPDGGPSTSYNQESKRNVYESNPPSRRGSQDSKSGGEAHQDESWKDQLRSESRLGQGSKDPLPKPSGRLTESTKRLPNVNQLLMQFNDLRQKKSLPQSDRSRLDNQLAEAYGVERNKMTELSTSRQFLFSPEMERLWKHQAQAYTAMVSRSSQYEAPVEIRKETKGVQFVGVQDAAVRETVGSKTALKLPPLPPRASRSASNASSSCSCGKSEGGGRVEAKSDTLRNAISPPTSISNYNSSQENLQTVLIPFGSHRPAGPVSSAGWSHIPSTESIDRAYKFEMAEAANFLRGLEERKMERRMETIQESSNRELLKDGTNPFNSTILNDRNIGHNIVQKMAPQTTEPSVPQSPHVMRRIKEEPPIPMSMIRADFKFSEQSVHSLNRISRPALIDSQGRTNIGDDDFDGYPLTGSGMVVEEPLNIITLDNVGSVNGAKTGFGILKSSSYSRSKAVKFKDMQSERRISGELSRELKRSSSDTVADRVDKNSQNVSHSRKFDIVLAGNSENLVHSPPNLSSSEDSSAINSSNVSMNTFFDNDLIPGVKTFSNSEEKLHQRRWIDAFVNEITR